MRQCCWEPPCTTDQRGGGKAGKRPSLQHLEEKPRGPWQQPSRDRRAVTGKPAACGSRMGANGHTLGQKSPGRGTGPPPQYLFLLDHRGPVDLGLDVLQAEVVDLVVLHA